jgi:hypothetical protein
MGRKVGQIVACGRRTWLVRVYNGRDPETKKRKYLNQSIRGGSNPLDWEAARLLEWQREKAGTIEALHDVLKNELAVGVMPCGRFGANCGRLG